VAVQKYVLSSPIKSSGCSILLATTISTSFAQNDDSDFIKNRNSHPLWNGSLKRDIQGFKPGMTESEAKQALSGCEVSGHKVLCLVSSKGERFELSLTEHTRPRLVKEVTYVFPAGGATLETMAKNVMMQFGVGNSQQCLPPPQGTGECSQWELEDGSYMRVGVDAYRRNMFLYCQRRNGLAVWKSRHLRRNKEKFRLKNSKTIPETRAKFRR
jgi:hypothetical protein